MATPLPALRGTSQQALYPFKRTIKCSTLVSVSQVGDQQRSILDLPRITFDLPFTKLSASDKNSMMSYAASALGQASTGGAITLGNVTYGNLSLDSDIYQGTVRAATMWDVEVRLTQTQAQNLTPTTTLGASIISTDTVIQLATVVGFNGYIFIGAEAMLVTWTVDATHVMVQRGVLGTTAASHSSGATVSWGPGFVASQPFPQLPNGTYTQIPWQQGQRYKTEVSAMDAGPKFTFPWYGGGLSNFPFMGLSQWNVGGDMLTDAETALLEAHFLANWGRMWSFHLTEPETGLLYAGCYYTSDEMTIEYIEPNVNRVSLAIESYGTGIPGTPIPPPPVPIGKVATSAWIVIQYSHAPGGGYDAFAEAFAGYFGLVTGNSGLVIDNSTVSQITKTAFLDAGTLSGLTNGSLSVSFLDSGSLSGTASPPDSFDIYNLWIVANNSDGTWQLYRYGDTNIIPQPTTGTATAGSIGGPAALTGFNVTGLAPQRYFIYTYCDSGTGGSSITGIYQLSVTSPGGGSLQTVHAVPSVLYSGTFVQATPPSPDGNYILWVDPIAGGLQITKSFTFIVTPDSQPGGPSAPLQGVQIVPVANGNFNPPINGPVISVNFTGGNTPMGSTETAGVVPRSNWNNASGSSGGFIPMDETGALVPGVQFQWSSSALSQTGITDSPGDNRMMKGFLSNNHTSSPGNVSSFSFGGLANYATLQLKHWTPISTLGP